MNDCSLHSHKTFPFSNFLNVICVAWTTYFVDDSRFGFDSIIIIFVFSFVDGFIQQAYSSTFLFH